MYYKIEGLTIAISNMEQMLQFYQRVFDLKFERQDQFGTVLYSSNWDNLKLLFCPKEITGVSVNRNRQQFDIIVANLDTILQVVQQNGGSLMHEIQTTETQKAVGIMDPDGNSIVLKELLN